jgi:Flp pilus assembly pilin Flp
MGCRPRDEATKFTNSRGFRRMNAIRQFIHEEDGQDVVEYGLLIATIAIVVLVGISFFGNNIGAWFEVLAKRITTNT